MKFMLHKGKLLLALLTLLLLAGPTGWAGSTLHIGFGAGTDCAAGCGGDPNLSPGASAIFDIFQTSGGAPTIDPVLLILGVPNMTSPTLFNDNSIIGLTSINPYPDGTAVALSDPGTDWTFGDQAGAFGLTNGTDGFQGEFTASTGGDVYGFLGIGKSVNNSNNWTNWHGAVLTFTGIDATGFGIYVFDLNATLGPHGLLNVEFSDAGTVPKGSILISYGQGSAFSTPFTEAGFQTPEPTSLLLMGTGLLAVGRLCRKKKRS